MYNNLFLQHDAEMERALEKCPVCSYCKQPIQDDYLYEIDESVYCEDCMKDLFRRYVEVE